MWRCCRLSRGNSSPPAGLSHGGSVEGAALAFSGVEADPVDQLADGFGALVSGVKAGRPGRLLIFIDEMDSLSPAQRWQLIDGVRLLMRSKPEVTVIFSVGRESHLEIGLGKKP